MKTISSALDAHLAERATTLATCWRITRTDAETFYFTDHDTDIVFDGNTYQATTGMIPSQLTQRDKLAVDNMEVVAFLELEKILEADIIAGLFDYATVDIFVVNYEDLTMGAVYLAQEWTLGNVETRDNDFQVEIRGKAQHLHQNVCALYQPGCRATLGDARCGIDLDDSAASYRYEGTVTSVTDRRTFIDSSTISSSGSVDVYRYGTVVWGTPSSSGDYTGNNATYEMEIKSWDPATGTFTLFQPMPNDINVDDEFTAYYGCDGTRETCRDTYNNMVNFDGEPDLPGLDKLLNITYRAAEYHEN